MRYKFLSVAVPEGILNCAENSGLNLSFIGVAVFDAASKAAKSVIVLP